jgi:GNAT superfamily N-acetyltransferase
MTDISPLIPSDEAHWHRLAREYMAFYKTIRTDAEYNALWQRIFAQQGIHAVGIRVDGVLVGLAHYFFHSNVWTADICYLQDLYVDNAYRGQGLGKALIEHVAQQARAHGSPRLYWMTQSSNETARRLYDKVAAHTGFIRYEMPLIG